MTITLHGGDCLAVIPQLVAEGVVVDAVVTDPPYDLTAMAKRFGKAGSAPAQHGRDGAMARLSGGFMNCQWDSTGIAFRPETWAAISAVMRPGAFLLAFGGTRTSHRMICAIEDAGFVIQDKIFWCFGSGFPKRRDMLKPAYEDICVAYKPGGKRTLQVDECRIDVGDKPAQEYTVVRLKPGATLNRTGGNWRPENGGIEFHGRMQAGRWPANVIHDGSDEVMGAFAAFDAPGQQGNLTGNEPSECFNGVYSGPKTRLPFRTRRDGEVSADRRYVEQGATDFALRPGQRRSAVNSPSRFFYQAKADSDDRFGSRHPTIKPVELLKWLVPLVTPKGGIFLDPFAGSGTSAIAALATGRSAILIEQSPDYCADIRARIAHYQGDGQHSLAAKARHRQRSQDKVGTLL
jgi:site-specific DNA-methyltransferase (adenine-specific)